MNDQRVAGVGERLSRALERWEPGGGARPDKKHFAAVMRSRMKPRDRSGQKGLSYPSVLAYFEGTSVPSLEWLLEASDVLGVRFEYLATGSEPMTAAELAITQASGAAAASGPRDETIAEPDEILRGFVEGLPVLGLGASPTTWNVVADFHAAYFIHTLTTTSRIAETMMAAGNFAEAEDAHKKLEAATAREAAEVIGAGAARAGIDLARLSSWQRDRYIQLSAQALSLLFVQPHDIAGRPGWQYKIGTPESPGSAASGTVKAPPKED